MWGLAHLDAAGAFPSAGEEACAELTALAQIAFYLAEPAGEAAGIGEGGPEVIDIGLKTVFETHDARPVFRSQ